jgi:hypothetical protein
VNSGGYLVIVTAPQNLYSLLVVQVSNDITIIADRLQPDDILLPSSAFDIMPEIPIDAASVFTGQTLQLGVKFVRVHSFAFRGDARVNCTRSLEAVKQLIFKVSSSVE